MTLPTPQEHGVFASVVFCTPLLLIASTIMCLSLRSTVNMMIVTKRLELKQSLRAKEQQEKDRKGDSLDAESTPLAEPRPVGERLGGAPGHKAATTQAAGMRLGQASSGKDEPVRRRK
jgi:hypothetical protein